MHLIRVYPDEHKWEGKGFIVMAWHKVLPDGNYDFDDIIRVFQQHREELGIDISDSDIAEIVNVEGIGAMNAYMRLGEAEFFGLNHWYGKED